MVPDKATQIIGGLFVVLFLFCCSRKRQERKDEIEETEYGR